MSGSLLINPKPGPDEIAGYGDPRDPSGGASSVGFQLSGGIAGTFWGSLGYRLHLRYTTFTDRFYGMGQKWVYTTTGASAESYVTVIAGLTSSF